MSIFRDFFVKEKPVFTGIARGVGGFGLGAGGPGGTPIQASGGEIVLGTSQTIDGVDYKYHYFKTPGTFLIPDAATFDANIDVLVISGGGSGGNRSGGGGGAGGIAVAEDLPFGASTGPLSIPITVGGGGPINNPGGHGEGNDGDDSRFGGPGDSWNVYAEGGGGGGGGNTTGGGAGGSGGGGHYQNPGAAGSQPNHNPGKSAWVTNYGTAGSTGAGPPNHQSGAGGGAGSAALAASQPARGAAGDGVQLPDWNVTYYMPNTDPWWPGISPLPGTHFGGGGGAGDYPPYLSQRMPGDATNGGGGIGGPASGAGPGSPGVNGLGGAGGGASGENTGPDGGYGGSGMVVIRYLGSV